MLTGLHDFAWAKLHRAGLNSLSCPASQRDLELCVSCRCVTDLCAGTVINCQWRFIACCSMPMTGPGCMRPSGCWDASSAAGNLSLIASSSPCMQFCPCLPGVADPKLVAGDICLIEHAYVLVSQVVGILQRLRSATQTGLSPWQSLPLLGPVSTAATHKCYLAGRDHRCCMSPVSCPQ